MSEYQDDDEVDVKSERDAASENGDSSGRKFSQEPDHEDSEFDDDDEEGDDDLNEDLEPLPIAPAYDPRYEQISQKLLGIPNVIAVKVDDSDCDTPEANKLRAKLEQVRSLPEREPQTIALYGDAGQGKSSLVNALTNIPRLAKAVDMGKSVTHVPMYYKRAAVDQRLQFSARIEYFDLDTMVKLLEDAFSEWRIYHLEKDPEWTNAEEEHHIARAATTENTFRSAFCNINGFRTTEEVNETLHELATSDNVVQSIKSTTQIATTMGNKFPNGTYSDFHECRDQDRLGDWLEPQVRENEDDPDESSLWPFIKRVVIGVRGCRFLDQWTIADLPGLSDIDHVRVNNTLSQTHHCDYIFVVSSLSRIITNSTVNNAVRKYAPAYGDRLMVIVTKSEDNLSSGVERDLVRTNKKLEERQSTYQSVRDELKSQITGVSPSRLQGRRRKKAKHTSDELSAQQLNDLTAKLSIVENDWFEAVHEARCAHVTRQLQGKMQRYLPRGAQLSVFCVSSKHYEARDSDAPQTLKRQLRAESTGIPTLRCHLLSLASQTTMTALQDFIDYQFALFVGGCELWTGNQLTSGRDELVKVVMKPLKAIPGAFDECRENIDIACQDLVLNPLSQNEGLFVNSAVVIVDNDLAGRPWSVLKTFIRHHGHHKTPTMPVSWNVLFTERLRSEMEDNWKPWTGQSLQAYADLEGNVLKIVGSVVRLVDCESAALCLPTEAFAVSVNARMAGLSQTIKSSQASLSKRLWAIQAKIVEDPNNFLGQALSGGYEVCRQDSGKGVVKRSLDTLKSYIGQREGRRSAFATMNDLVEAAVNEASQAELDPVLRATDRTFVAIAQDLESIVKENKMQDPEEESLRDDIRPEVPVAREAFEALKRDFMQLKLDYHREALED